MRHTPTPWTVSKLKRLPNAVVDETGVVVADCDIAKGYIMDDGRRGNAMLIVAACNDYEKLQELREEAVQALEYAKGFVRGYCKGLNQDPTDLETYKQIEKALTLDRKMTCPAQEETHERE